MVATGLHVVLEKNPLIHKLWVVNKDKWKYFSKIAATSLEIVRLVRGLRREKFDLSIDLSGLLRSGLITWAGGARYKLGLAESNEGSPFFYTHKIRGGMDNHAIDRYLSIAKALGCVIGNIEYPMVPFNKNPEICKNLPEEYVVIAPSAGKEANRWPAERFGKLAEKLQLPSVVISSSADSAIAEKVVEKSNGKAVSLAGKTNL